MRAQRLRERHHAHLAHKRAVDAGAARRVLGRPRGARRVSARRARGRRDLTHGYPSALHRRSRQRSRQALTQYLRPRADSLGRVRQILPPLRRSLARRRHPRRPIRRRVHPVRAQRRLHHRTRFIFLPPRPRRPRRSPRNRRSHRRRLRRRRERCRRRSQRRAPHRSRRRRRARFFHVFPPRVIRKDAALPKRRAAKPPLGTKVIQIITHAALNAQCVQLAPRLFKYAHARFS